MKKKAIRFLSVCLAALLLVNSIPVETAFVSAQEVQQEKGNDSSGIRTEPEQILQEAQEAEPEENPGAALPGVDVEVQPGLKKDPAKMNAQMKVAKELLGEDAVQSLSGENKEEGLPMVCLGGIPFRSGENGRKPVDVGQ